MNRIVHIVFFILCFAHLSYASPKFLTISDIHYGSQNTTGDGKDTGDEGLFMAMSKFKELSKDVDFILTLGDLPTHLLGYSPEKADYEKTVFHNFFEANVHLKPMFYISGNNDPLSGNYQPFEIEGKSPLSIALDWSGACMHCEGLILDDTHMASGGYYSSYVIPGNKDIILVVLNTTQWIKGSIFFPKYRNQEIDALVQLNWFNEQLKKHHAKQLLVAMHIPPGNNYTGGNFWKADYLKRFLAVLEANQSAYGQISLITSHTHMDEFRKIELKNNKNIYAYSTPAVSRIHHNNSAMKLFSLDESMQIKDFITYYTSSEKEWGQEQYHALGSVDAILPHCDNKTLSQCLDDLRDEQVCEYLEQGLFYGVKSPRVRNEYCNHIYKVNQGYA